MASRYRLKRVGLRDGDNLIALAFNSRRRGKTLGRGIVGRKSVRFAFAELRASESGRKKNAFQSTKAVRPDGRISRPTSALWNG